MLDNDSLIVSLQLGILIDVLLRGIAIEVVNDKSLSFSVAQNDSIPPSTSSPSSTKCTRSRTILKKRGDIHSQKRMVMRSYKQQERISQTEFRSTMTNCLSLGNHSLCTCPLPLLHAADDSSHHGIPPVYSSSRELSCRSYRTAAIAQELCRIHGRELLRRVRPRR